MGEFVIALIPAVIPTVILYFALGTVARSRQQRGQGSGPGVARTLSNIGTFTSAFQRALDVTGIIHAEILDADPYHGTILARTDPAGGSFGSVMKLVVETVEGVTTLQLEVQPVLWWDWGQSGKVVRDFEEAWRLQEAV